MKKSWAAACVILFVLFLGGTVGWLQFPSSGLAETTSGTDALIRIEVKVPVQSLGLPVYAHLLDTHGKEYVLVITSPQQVADKGLSYQVLDYAASPGAYILALERRKGAREAAEGRFTILYDDGRRIVVKGGPAVSAELSELGFDLNVLPAKPMVLGAPLRCAETRRRLRSARGGYDQRGAAGGPLQRNRQSLG